MVPSLAVLEEVFKLSKSIISNYVYYFRKRKLWHDDNKDRFITSLARSISSECIAELSNVPEEQSNPAITFTDISHDPLDDNKIDTESSDFDDLMDIIPFTAAATLGADSEFHELLSSMEEDQNEQLVSKYNNHKYQNTIY